MLKVTTERSDGCAVCGGWIWAREREFLGGTLLKWWHSGQRRAHAARPIER